MLDRRSTTGQITLATRSLWYHYPQTNPLGHHLRMMNDLPLKNPPRVGPLRAIALVLVVSCVCNFSKLGRTVGITTTQTTTRKTTTTITDVKTEIKTWPESLIYDKTLSWDPHVYRPWLDKDLPADQRPPAMILLTTYGWNQKDQTQAMKHGRTIRETGLLNGVINHPWFHPTLWDDLEGKKNVTLPADIRYYVFSDVHQCGESNWPIYGGGKDNFDTSHNRSKSPVGQVNFVHNPTVSQSRLFTDNTLAVEKPRAVAVTFDCRGWGVPGIHHHQNRINGTTSKLLLSVVSLSSLISNSNDDLDQGLIAPAGKPAHLTAEQVQDIETCQAESKRKFYFVYAGNYRVGRNSAFTAKYGGARGAYAPFNDNERFFVSRYFNNEFQKSSLSNYTYEEFMSNTIFALASRGDNKFSYRFTEVLSAGAIPVVHADDWVWPFRPELIDWNECAVILPEKDAGNTTIQYLESISVEQRCKMRQACYRIYKKYAETTAGTITGIVEGLELVATRGSSSRLQGVRCDEFEISEECNLLRRR